MTPIAEGVGVKGTALGVSTFRLLLVILTGVLKAASSASRVALGMGWGDGDGLAVFLVAFVVPAGAFLLTPLVDMVPLDCGAATTESSACTRADLRKDMIRPVAAILMIDARLMLQI